MTDHSKPQSLLIIYTGGTIGMVKDPVTGSLHPFQLGDILKEIPDLKKTGFYLSSYTFSPLLDSSNINPSVWIKLAEIILENYQRFDGFVVLHGTDTMAYSASALSFMLENLDKPVIFTGSQLPIGLLRTDAKENLVTAIEIAASFRNGKAAVPEVSIFFQSVLFRGNRTTKHNAEEFNAFKSYNYPVLAESGVHLRFNHPAIHVPDEGATFSVSNRLDSNVTIMKLFPGISQKVVRSTLAIEGMRAVILETFGAGNAPDEDWFLDEIGRAIKRGVIIVSVTQCPEGRVEMGMYETSKSLQRIGVISGHDITTEAAITKMMYLLGKYESRKEVMAGMSSSLRGEISIS
jgi:L-asparaginase